MADKPRPDKQFSVTLKDGKVTDIKESTIKALNPSDPNYLGKVIQELIIGDDEIHAIAKGMAKLAIKEAVQILTRGTPRDKAALLAKFLPYIAKSLTEDKSTGEFDELKSEFAAMKVEMMETFSADPVTEKSALQKVAEAFE